MIRGIYTAAAGMAAEMAKQDVIANNLANLNTDGFKQDKAIFRTRMDKTIYRVEAEGGARAGMPAVKKMGDLSTGVYLDQVATERSQGTMRQTDEPLDLAISGDGYFGVEGTNGEELLTRGGSFSRDHQGYIVDMAGRRLLGESGPIRLSGTDPVHIDQQGVVFQGNRRLSELRIATVANPDVNLSKRGDTAWSLKDPTAMTSETRPQVMQGYLESSNVNPMREMVEMITGQRSYEASQKLILAQDETLGKAVNDLGRV